MFAKNGYQLGLSLHVSFTAGLYMWQLLGPKSVLNIHWYSNIKGINPATMLSFKLVSAGGLLRPLGLFTRAVPQPGSPWPVLLQEVLPFQVQGFTSILTELQKVPVSKVNESSMKTIISELYFLFSFLLVKSFLMLSALTFFIINLNYNFSIFPNTKK